MEEDYKRSKSYGGSGTNTMQMESYYGPTRAPPPPPTSYELTSYSASYSQAQMGSYNYNYNNRDVKKGKAAVSRSKSSSWALTDPEMQRKKRVASYKMYAVEGKMKGGLRKSFRWLKVKYSQLVYGL